MPKAKDDTARAKLIFNASAGNPTESAQQLSDLLTHLQAQQISADVFMVTPDSQIADAAREAVRDGFELIIVSGGDGTIETVADVLVGSKATLGIVPTGTRNNLARSLGIPTKVPEAVALLGAGKRIKVDVGHAKGSEGNRHFLEAAAAGLPAALFEPADHIQRGDLSKLGDFLSTLVSYPPSKIKLTLDREHEATANAHMVVVANMPFMAANWQLVSDLAVDDGVLDVLVFSNLSKLDLVGYVVQLATGAPADPRIVHYQVKELRIDADPPMPMTADGIPLGEGPLTVSVKRAALSVIVGDAVNAHLSQTDKKSKAKA